MLTFLRWESRDPLHLGGDGMSLREPLIVINDCLNLTVQSSKSSLSPSFSATLIGTDINYSTAIAPGDFCLVNIVKYDEQTRVLYDKVKANKPINSYEDGFKGIFKVQSVRRRLAVTPDGQKRVIYSITGFAFTELNNVIYFNPFLLTDAEKQRQINLFVTNLGDEWRKAIGTNKILQCQQVMLMAFRAMLGESFTKETSTLKGGQLKTENRQFKLPEGVAKLLGISGAKYAADMYRVIAGIQKYDRVNPNSKPEKGLRPTNIDKDGDISTTKDMCQGTSLNKADYWNQVQAWSILKQYQNPEVNELFTCHRVDPNGRVLPTIIFRQIPFTTEHFKSNITSTKFLSLPRWKIDTNLILNFDLGRDEAARVNFVQVFGNTQLGVTNGGINAQISDQNFDIDKDDIVRHGLKPLVSTSQFDFPDTEAKQSYKASDWAKLRGDWLIGGQLKENGTVVSIGIQEPISEGDNFQLGDMVFHIEAVSHSCEVNAMGVKSFRTSLQLSNGVSEKSNKSGPVYNEMENTDAHTYRKNKLNQDIMPGIGDVQDIPGRVQGEETTETKEKPFQKLSDKLKGLL